MKRTNLLSYGWHWTSRCVAAAGLAAISLNAFAQEPISREAQRRLGKPSAQMKAREASLIEQVIEPELTFSIEPQVSKIVKTKLPVTRIAITDPSVVEVNEFTPTEFEVIGQRAGETTVTLWFEEPNGNTRLLRYLVKVGAAESEQIQAEIEFARLESRVNELFPNSQVQLIPVADKLIIRGQARDSKEAAEILSLLMGGNSSGAGTGGASGGGGYAGYNGSSINGGVLRIPGAENLRVSQVVNLLHIPGEQQVLLKVRVAELTRNAIRDLSVDFTVLKDSWALSSAFGGTSNVRAIMDSGDVNLFVRALSTNGYGKLLAEPQLVTISGQPATFIAGGEFAVPTAVGVNGIGAIATTFRGFGTQLSFTPTVVDKDRIRLQVSPSVSSLNQGAAVNGIPGLNIRGANTTVDLREGQWLALAGLIQDEQQGSRRRLPLLGDIPVAGALFGSQNKTRNETELLILVSPELVHPLEPDEAPHLLPGMSLTDPTDCAFYLLQHIEGHPDFHHRSTVWPSYRQHVVADYWIQKHRQDKASPEICGEQDYYIDGPHGLSE
jgi:pilus assembly protein CpaC